MGNEDHSTSNIQLVAPSPPPKQMDPGFLMMVANSDDLASILEHDLREEYYDYDSKTWQKRKDVDNKPLPPKMNEYGISEVMGQFRPFMHRLVYFSNYGEDSYSVHAASFLNRINMLIYVNGNKYGLKPANSLALVNLFVVVIDAALRRPVNNKERSGIYPNFSSVESRVDANYPMMGNKKRGLFDSLRI